MARKPGSVPSAPEGFGSLRGAFERVLEGFELPPGPKDVLPDGAPAYHVGQTGSPVHVGTLSDDGSRANGAPGEAEEAEEDDMDWLEMFASPPVGTGRSDFRVFDSTNPKEPLRISSRELQNMEIQANSRILDLHRVERSFENWRNVVDDAVTSFILEVKQGDDPNNKFVLIVTGRGQGRVRDFVEDRVLKYLLDRGDILKYVHFRDGAFKVQVS